MEKKREAFLAATEGLEGNRLVFLDEAGSHISMTREHAWAPVGERVTGHVPRNRGSILTMLGALTLDGLGTPPLWRPSERGRAGVSSGSPPWAEIRVRW